MNESRIPRFLAIDGGGTRCRLSFCSGGAVRSVETGPANVSTDLDGAVIAIKTGLKELAELSGFDEASLLEAPAFVGLAGMSGKTIKDDLRARLSFARIRIEDDRPAALRGALGSKDGVIAHCGTGSFFASQIDGRMKFAGGWGSVLADEASASWLGKSALRMTLAVVDQTAPPSELTEKILRDSDGATGIVRFAGSAGPLEFGALAPLVTAFAKRDDAVAQAIMGKGAQHIAEVLPKIGWKSGLPICLTGGLGPEFKPYLPANMRTDIIEPIAAPLDGALMLAQDFATEIAA